MNSNSSFGAEFIVAEKADARASFADASVSGSTYLAWVRYAQANHLMMSDCPFDGCPW